MAEQSEYVRVPFADSTLGKIPEEVSDEKMIIMCDIFPAGYYGTMKAITKLLPNNETPESIVQYMLQPLFVQPSKQSPLIKR